MTQPPIPQDLEDLLRELRGARDGAPGELLVGLLPRLRNLARRHLPAQSPLRVGLDSEDLLQEGLLQLVRHAGAFEGRTWAEFLAFASAILAQKTLQQARRQNVRSGELGGGVEPDHLPAEGATPSVDAAAHEDRRRVRELLAGLPEPYRTAMRLRLEGLSNQEIAQRLGEGEEVVRQRLARAVRMMQTKW